jgi:uncharacterized protein (TIGR02118 family)
MWQFVALYRRPEDPDAFVRQYRTTHLPLVKRFPALRRVTISRVEPDAGSAGNDIFLISTMYWDDRESLEAALQSEERAIAYEDTAKFRHYQIGRYIGEVEEC